MRVIALFAAASLARARPDLRGLPPIRREPQMTYVDRAGAVIGVRGGRYRPARGSRALPAYVPAAFVSIEDRRFYEHAGFDPVGMARAIVADLARPASARAPRPSPSNWRAILFLTADQTMERKATELVYAVQLEQTYSKKQILAPLPQPGLFRRRRLWDRGGRRSAISTSPAAKLTVARGGDAGRRS